MNKVVLGKLVVVLVLLAAVGLGVTAWFFTKSIIAGVITFGYFSTYVSHGKQFESHG